MQEFDHIQSLWQSHSVEVKISSEEMLAQAKKEVSGIKTRSLLNIFGMIISFAALVALLILYPFTSWTTQAGLTIIIIAIAVSTIILYKDYKIISRNDFTQHPNEFLLQLKIYQLNKFSIYNKLYWFYAAAICLGFILYFYEMLNNLDLWFQIGITTFTVFWMALCATFLRKAYLKREKERLDLLIEKFERISSQFKEQV
ncbi:hypothetical protein CPT03_10285 [Pedobacter ginsengisoli]|uniref:Uncharacterized protein n=1 Tax=Pedobacter ginsengisoli TaxID=363852 RepID=A0A2D1U5F9_9SPHI|nr:hypothetical protein [Pedobacter ginsengisoli]ATP56837.1 hypothetical protein CPT03_10285 [Pedobacter ginsengisoli]